jgi:hypothetical protein
MRRLLIALVLAFSCASAFLVHAQSPLTAQGAGVGTRPVFSRVQGATLDTTGTSVTVAYTTQNIVAGNLLTIAIRFAGNGTTGVLDNNNNNWVIVDSVVDASFGKMEFWAAQNAIAVSNGKPTITITDTVSGTIRAILEEYSGAVQSSAVDQHTTAAGSSTTPSVTSGTTLQKSELAIAYSAVRDSGGQAAGFNKDSNYTLGAVIPAGTLAKIATEYRILTATGAQTAGFVITPTQPWDMGIVTFRGQ